MNLVSAADLLGSLEFLERKIQWVKCPFCDDEVSKLRPCHYWQDGREVKTNVCVECAESVKGLPYLAQRFTIPGVDVMTELLPYYELPLDPKYTNEGSYRAKVFLGEWSFMVWPKNSRLAVLEYRKSPDQEKTYDNIFQVWFALKQTFEKGEPLDMEEKFAKTQSKLKWR